jgi:acetoin utilization deacetylase AcuC-like enzyme
VNQGKKVFILDFDSHCGDGTEYFFYQTDQVLYLSLHQYPAFPGKGYMNETGSGMGKGFTINVPLPPGSADDLYMESLRTFLPAAKEFGPDITAVSAGFDGHHSDPLLNLNLSTNVYFETGKMLSSEFEHVFAVLEGGYNLHYLPKCFENFLAGINGHEIRFIEEETRSTKNVIDEYERRMKKLKQYLRPFWEI